MTASYDAELGASEATHRGSGAAGTATASPAGTTASIGELIGDVSRDLSQLMRQELELAKAELRRSARRAGTGVALMAAGGLALVLALVFGSIAAWWAIGNELGRSWSALIVFGAWLLIALVLELAGRGQTKRARGLEQTAETVRKIPDALKGQDDSRGPHGQDGRQS